MTNRIKGVFFYDLVIRTPRARLEEPNEQSRILDEPAFGIQKLLEGSISTRTFGAVYSYRLVVPICIFWRGHHFNPVRQPQARQRIATFDHGLP